MTNDCIACQNTGRMYGCEGIFLPWCFVCGLNVEEFFDEPPSSYDDEEDLVVWQTPRFLPSPVQQKPTTHLSSDSYAKMLFNVNQRHKTKRQPAEKTECECGKITYVNNLKKHKTTKLHTELLRRKNHNLSL